MIESIPYYLKKQICVEFHQLTVPLLKYEIITLLIFFLNNNKKMIY
jgi:hypothetical protein